MSHFIQCKVLILIRQLKNPIRAHYPTVIISLKTKTKSLEFYLLYFHVSEGIEEGLVPCVFWPHKFYELTLKRTLSVKLGMVVHTYNPSKYKASLNYIRRPTLKKP